MMLMQQLMLLKQRHYSTSMYQKKKNLELQLEDLFDEYLQLGESLPHLFHSHVLMLLAKLQQLELG